MKLFVVAEDELGRQILAHLLPSAKLSRLSLVAATGQKYSAVSLARSLNNSRQAPVLLVIDARTVDEQSVMEQEADIEDLLSSRGPPLASRLVMAAPGVAAALFHAPEVLERVAGVRLTERMRIEARFVPRTVLAEVVRLSGRFADETELVRAIGPEDARKLARHPLIQTLEQNVRELLDGSPARQEKLRRTG